LPKLGIYIQNGKSIVHIIPLNVFFADSSQSLHTYNFLFPFRKMSTFSYTKDTPSESTFNDIQSLNKLSEAVSCVHVKFNLYCVR